MLLNVPPGYSLLSPSEREYNEEKKERLDEITEVLSKCRIVAERTCESVNDSKLIAILVHNNLADELKSIIEEESENETDADMG